MKSISIKLALAGMACAAATVALAAAPMQEGAAHAAPTHPPMMGGKMMGGGKKDGGMMGGDMMGMMRNCQSMMGASGEGAGPMHGMRMPPGNEKLELQMHAEMMQKMGEIAARYADRIKETQ
jgi:hypothetical protein